MHFNRKEKMTIKRKNNSFQKGSRCREFRYTFLNVEYPESSNMIKFKVV